MDTRQFPKPAVLDFDHVKDSDVNYYKDGHLGRLFNDVNLILEVSEQFVIASQVLILSIMTSTSAIKLKDILSGKSDTEIEEIDDTILANIDKKAAYQSARSPLEFLKQRYFAMECICTLDANNNVVLADWMKKTYLGNDINACEAMERYIKLMLETSFSAIFNPDASLRADVDLYLKTKYGVNIVTEGIKKYGDNVFYTQLMCSAAFYFLEAAILKYTQDDKLNYPALFSGIADNIRYIEDKSKTTIFDTYRQNRVNDISLKKYPKVLQDEMVNLQQAINNFNLELLSSRSKRAMHGSASSILASISIEKNQKFIINDADMSGQINVITNIQKISQALILYDSDKKKAKNLFAEGEKYFLDKGFIKKMTLPFFEKKEKKEKKKEEKVKDKKEETEIISDEKTQKNPESSKQSRKKK